MSATNNFNVEGCGSLAVTLAGGEILDFLLDNVSTAGANSQNSDGYMVSYVYSPVATDATCFGFEEDSQGYFCIGAEILEGYYTMHGAGYWNWTEEELAAMEEKEAEYNDLVEQGYSEEDIKAYYEMQEAAEDMGVDMIGDVLEEDYNEEGEEWLSSANWMQADYIPDQTCVEKYDEELGDMS